MTTIGVIGARWRARVSGAGNVALPDGSALDWWVAADDRWHVPADETTVRQRCVDGVPVVETSVRVPGGDVVHTAYAVANSGGLLVVEVANRSSLPVAVAFGRSDLLTSRPPTDVPTEGIDLPAGSIVLPIGHGSSVRVALAHHSPTAGGLPVDLPDAAQVARGWRAQLDRSPRLVLPDDALTATLLATRAALALDGAPDPDDDPAGFLLAADAISAGGEPAAPLAEHVAATVETLARRARGRALSWDEGASLRAAARVLRRAGEGRAADDVAAVSARLGAAGARPIEAPPGVRVLAWTVEGLVVPSLGGADLAPVPLPRAWLGQAIEVHGAEVPMGRVGFAIRWHGARPALLWECSMPMHLRTPGIDPTWSTDEPRGDALLAAPADV
jgi:hypothetical protein